MLGCGAVQFLQCLYNVLIVVWVLSGNTSLTMSSTDGVISGCSVMLSKMVLICDQCQTLISLLDTLVVVFITLQLSYMTDAYYHCTVPFQHERHFFSFWCFCQDHFMIVVMLAVLLCENGLYGPSVSNTLVG